LIQLKYGYIKNVAELSFETTGVGGDAAQVIVSGNHREPAASGAAGPQQRWCTGRGERQKGGLRFELQRRHDCFLCRPSAGINLI
jgi:hypothetical protein